MKALTLTQTRRKVARQFREAARKIAEGEQHYGCHACGGLRAPLNFLFSEVVFPFKDRDCIWLAGWLGCSCLGDGVWLDSEPYDLGCANRRVIGLLFCALYVDSITRDEFRAAGYKVK